MRLLCAATASLIAFTILAPSAEFGQAPSSRQSLTANAGPDQTITEGSGVTLDGSASYDPDGSPITYSWTLVSTPANSSASLQDDISVSPKFHIDKAGTYIAQLVVSNGRERSTPSTVTITTGNTPPVADAGTNQHVALGDVVQLDASASTDVNEDSLSYKWRLLYAPPGSSAVLSNPAAVNPTLSIDVAGTYIAQLIVNDGTADSRPARVAVTTSATLPPIANAGVNQTVAPGANVVLDGMAADPQFLPLTLKWALISEPAGSFARLSGGSSGHPTFNADFPGVYVAQLVASNGSAVSIPATVTITTSNTLPLANPGQRKNVLVDSPLTLDGTGSTSPNHTPLSYSWSFLSRADRSNALLSDAAAPAPTFVADTAGVYVLQLIVNDGVSKSKPRTVTVTASSSLYANAIVHAISATRATVGQNLQAPITVTLTPAPPSTGVAVTITSSSPAKALVGNNRPSFTININPGENPFTIPVEALANSGTVTVTISAPGYTSASSIITLAHSGFVIAGSKGIGGALIAFEGTSTPLTVSSGYLDTLGKFVAAEPVRPGFTVTVPVTSSAPGIGTILGSPVTFANGIGHATATFKASATKTGITTISAGTPAGFTPAKGNTLNVTVEKAGLIAFKATVGQKLEAAQTISLSAPAPANVQVTLTSADPTRVKFSTSSTQVGLGSITLTIPANHASSPPFFVQAFAASGSVAYTAVTGTFGSTTGAITLAAPGLGIQSLGGFGANFTEAVIDPAATLTVVTGYLNSSGQFVQQQLVGPAASVPVTVVSGNTAVGAITASPITIKGGASAAATAFQPKAVGTAVVTASSAGFKSAQVTATVVAFNPPLLFSGGNSSIGKDLETQFNINLPRKAGAGGVAVTIQSNSGVLAVAPNAITAGTPQITVTVPANLQSATFYVQATSNAGTATFTAKASGFRSTTGTVTLVPAGIFMLPPFITGKAGTTLTTVSVNTAALDPLHGNAILVQENLAGGRPPLTVSLHSSNSAVAGVPATVAILPGKISASVPVKLGSSGSATITIAQPAGFVPPSVGTSIPVTVTP